jgi:hypothetical protein
VAEDAVRHSMAALMAGATTIVITHRLARARDADEILVLDGGRIAERGRHPELAAGTGLYAELLRRETGEERDASPPARLTAGPRIPGRGGGVAVALVDSGVNTPHPHVPRVAGGVTIAVEDGQAVIRPGHRDLNGHGTACAALVAYLAPEAEIHAIKIFEHELRARPQALVAAIRWAVERRVPVVNLSLGTVAGEHIEPLRAACREAVAAGTVLVAAAPQGGPPSYPAEFEEVIAVGEDRALGDDDLRFAGEPGLDFLASGYARPRPGLPPELNLKGSSFAAARVAAIVARLLEAEPGLAPAAVRERLRALCLPPASGA